MINKEDISQIEKYLKGELNARAMHELERRALDDPFLMDALEGYGQTENDQHANLDELTNRLHERTDKKIKRMIPWGPISIAASVLIALGIGLLFFTNRDQQVKPHALAQNLTPPVQQKATATPPPTSITDKPVRDSIKAGAIASNSKRFTKKENEQIASADAAVPILSAPPTVAASEFKKSQANPALKEMPIAENKVKARTDTSANYEYKSVAVKKPVITDQVLKSRAEGVTVTSDPNRDKRAEADVERLIGKQPTTLKQDITQARIRPRDTSSLNEVVVSDYASQNKKEKNNANAPASSDISQNSAMQFGQNANGTQKTISGHVKAKDDGQPIIGATVKVIGKSFGVVTDVNGKFILKDVPANAYLVVAYIGYNSTKVKINNTDSLNVALEPNTSALNEVVVTGHSAQNKDTEETTQSARPADEWPAFRKYVDSTATSPDGKTGKIRLSFVVDGNGGLSDFKIIKSLSNAADQKAIDLVKNGPAWTGASDRKPQRVRITIKFH